MSDNEGRLPAGMRNNNPGNLKYTGSRWQQRNFPGMVGPSVNTDQGDPQIVFESAEAGMYAAARLALGKHRGGRDTVREMIAGAGGWTPGYHPAAVNVAASMGVDPDERVNFLDPSRMFSFLRALFRQEHGPASDRYSDELIRNNVVAVLGGQSYELISRVEDGLPPGAGPVVAMVEPDGRRQNLRGDRGFIPTLGGQLPTADGDVPIIGDGNAIIAQVNGAAPIIGGRQHPTVTYASLDIPFWRQRQGQDFAQPHQLGGGQPQQNAAPPLSYEDVVKRRSPDAESMFPTLSMSA